MDKKDLRKIYRAKRKAVQNKAEKDHKIALRLLESRDIESCDTVLIYISIDSEIDTSFIISELLKKEKRVAVPKCSKDGVMEFIYIRSPDELISGMYGIPEPSGSEVAVITDKTVCIVPALAFTPDGVRLGYGGGYYDRFLAVHSNISTIGLCYECIVAESLPSEEYDIKIKKFITEERTVLCSAKG